MSLKDYAVVQQLSFLARAVKYAWRIDPEEIGLLRRALKPGDVAIDVGAHKGGYLYWLQRAVAPSGRVIAFEPQRAAAEYLTHMTRRLGYRTVEVHNCAVSNAVGTATLFHPTSRVSTGATLVSGLFQENDAADQVPVVTLDAFLAARSDLKPPRYIKIDVETHELAVLQGAAGVLRAAAPVVQLEADQHVYGDRPITVLFDFLREAGLEGFFFVDGKLLPLREFDLPRHQPQALRHRPQSPSYASNFLFLSPRADTELLRHYRALR